MSVPVRIPTPLRRLTAGRNVVEVEGETIREIMDNLETSHPGFKDKIFTAEGSLKRFVNIYVNENDIRTLDDLATRIRPGDSVAIVPAIAGGR
jgi:molybdopterin synthase sulfur carrier subunit